MANKYAQQCDCGCMATNTDIAEHERAAEKQGIVNSGVGEDSVPINVDWFVNILTCRRTYMVLIIVHLCKLDVSVLVYLSNSSPWKMIVCNQVPGFIIFLNVCLVFINIAVTQALLPSCGEPGQEA